MYTAPVIALQIYHVKSTFLILFASEASQYAILNKLLFADLFEQTKI